MSAASQLRAELVQVGNWLEAAPAFAGQQWVADRWFWLWDYQGHKGGRLTLRPCIERIDPSDGLTTRAIWTADCADFAVTYAAAVHELATYIAGKGYPRAEALHATADAIDGFVAVNATIPPTGDDWWQALPPQVKLGIKLAGVWLAIDTIDKLGGLPRVR